jgi:hypothetical protein
MRYAFALLLGLGVMLGATAQTAPRLGDVTVPKSEAAAPALKQNVWYRGGYYNYGYGYERPWFRHYYHRPYWGGYYRPYWGGNYHPWGGYYRPHWGGYYRPWGYRHYGWDHDD